jgi:hypothetical protein
METTRYYITIGGDNEIGWIYYHLPTDLEDETYIELKEDFVMGGHLGDMFDKKDVAQITEQEYNELYELLCNGDGEYNETSNCIEKLLKKYSSEKYYLFTFEDAFDDAFGNSHKFIGEMALSNRSIFYPSCNECYISKTEITKEEYDEWDEIN